ncbi:MAG: pyruvate dehydrogenase (acetyl-transferring), homodimeric type [Candidatus Dormibacteria bacterium]
MNSTDGTGTPFRERWAAHLPRDVRDTGLDLLARRSLPAAWSVRWAENPKANCLFDVYRGWITAEHLESLSRRVAGRLRTAGIARGDRMLFSASSSLCLVVAHVAALRAGIVVVPANTAYRERELSHIVRDSQPKAALVDDNERGGWVTAADDKVLVVDPSVDLPDGPAGELDLAAPRDPALIVYTSGTTGAPKGPVRGNGQIIQELESMFSGAGWNVIKVLWGSDWDALFSRDHNRALLRRFARMVDGEYQTLGANDGEYNRSHFFESDPELKNLVAHMTTAEINGLTRGGHDVRKLYAAFSAAKAHKGQPTVILAATKKGFGMGRAGESRMTTHQQKKLDMDALREFRDRFKLPLGDQDLAEMSFYRPDADSAEISYLTAQRVGLGGQLPARSSVAPSIPIPALTDYARFAVEADGKEMSTTMAAVRLLGNLLRDGAIGPRIVPIVADEARTFGMANLFRQVGIYSPVGQLYEPEDTDSMLSYRESTDGQLLEEGISEAGALASWIAAATSYSVSATAMLPVYTFYSMFGFQRVGDLIWAGADQRARGFLIGATSGRTTLGGEGLQHQDGSSHVVAATVPTCRAYDPAFAHEFAVIFDHGARQMMERQEDVFYYITVTNENYPQPSLRPADEEGIIKGMYRLEGDEPTPEKPGQVQLLGSGAILREVLAAAQLLREDWSVSSHVWSVTSYAELARDASECLRWNRLHPDSAPRQSHLADCLGQGGPIVAASDYVRAYPQLIASFVGDLVVLGTDGFGRSDTRGALRRFFEVDRHAIVVSALSSLSAKGTVKAAVVKRAIKRYGIDPEAPPPWTV